MDDHSIRQILETLGSYERMSGQKVNLLKSRIYCSKNVTHQEKEEVAENLGLQMDDDKRVYLGIPYLVGRPKKEIFAFVKDKVWKKLKGWKEKVLSQASREILIKSIAQAIPTYIMSCFKLSKGLCNEIRAMVRNFW